jgi:hypothetical protein
MVVPHVTRKHNYYVSRGQSNSMWPFQDNILAAHGKHSSGMTHWSAVLPTAVVYPLKLVARVYWIIARR